MKLLHKLKGKNAKTNVLELQNTAFSTKHVHKDGKLTHLGWAITGKQPDKGHEYTLLFSPEEAAEFKKWLDAMLPRFASTNLDDFIVNETHDEEK